MDTLLTILPIVLTVVLSFGVVLKYGLRIINLLNELKQLLEVVVSAFTADEDGVVRITKEELQQIVDEAKDIPAAVSKLIKKRNGNSK